MNAWIATAISATALLLTGLGLYLTDRRWRNQDVRKELDAKFGQLTATLRHVMEKQDKQSGDINDLRQEQGRLGQSFEDHAANDRDLHAKLNIDLERMFNTLRADIRACFPKPEHEDDVPATRRDIRHMQANLMHLYEGIQFRVSELEKKVR